jgi:hypothetical protein
MINEQLGMILKILVIMLIISALSAFTQSKEVFATTYDPLGLIKSNNYQLKCGIFDPCNNQIIQLFPFMPFSWNLENTHNGNVGIDSLDKNMHNNTRNGHPILLTDLPFP